MRPRTVSGSPGISTVALSGILSILTGCSRGKRLGITRLNVASVMQAMISPIIATYPELW